MGMWKHNLLRFGRKRWYKPAKKNSRSQSAEELCHHEARCIDRTNPGKCICERSRERYRRISKGRRSREPVCAGDVKTHRYRNRFGAQTGTAPNDTQQPERCNEFAKKLPATGAGVLRDLYKGFAKHQMRRAHADKCTQHLGDDIRRGIAPAKSRPDEASASVTAGLKCAPEIGPNVKIKVTNVAPVARVLASRAMAILPSASLSPMMPEPTTAARRNAVPKTSATMRRERVITFFRSSNLDRSTTPQQACSHGQRR